MSQPQLPRNTLLRGALMGNALFSALSAGTLLAFAPELQIVLGLLEVDQLRALGAQLALFAAWVAWLALRRVVPRRQAWLVVGLDGAWVLGSIALLLAPPASLTAAGRGMVACVALCVAAFGVLQAAGLLRSTPRVGAVDDSAGERRSPAALVALGAAVLVAAATPAAVRCEEPEEALADLRTEELLRTGLTESAARLGREHLERAAVRHGLKAWSERRTLDVVARDEWPLLDGKSYGHFPEPVQRFRMQMLLGTFTSRLELLDGRGRGEVWGIQSWAGYRQKPGDPAVAPSAERRIVFYLPTLQYFSELPFRLREAPIVVDAGDADLRGKMYHRILVTWGSLEANPDHDQYVLWIDRETGWIAKAHYTVRDAFRSAQGTMHFEDFRNVQSVWLPFRQTVTIGSPEQAPEPLEKGFFHRLLVEEARFDDFDVSLLRPYPDRPESGDRKPLPDR